MKNSLATLVKMKHAVSVHLIRLAGEIMVLEGSDAREAIDKSADLQIELIKIKSMIEESQGETSQAN